MQSLRMADNKSPKRATSVWWETSFRQDTNISASDSTIPTNLNLLSETIQSNRQERSCILKSTKRHLKQIIMEYEALDMEMPCIRKFEKPPVAQPLTLCMECPPEKDFSHVDIMKAVEYIVPQAFEKKQVYSIQFENINVICGTTGQKNRWLITVSDFETRDLYLRSGLMISNDYFPLRRLDDVTLDDYNLHLRRALARKKILDMLRNSTGDDRFGNFA